MRKTLRPLFTKFFAGIRADKTLAAFTRRIDVIVPFLPFTEDEQLAAADTMIRRLLAEYRAPPVLVGPPDRLRLIGNTVQRLGITG